jgi:hypothetical protein
LVDLQEVDGCFFWTKREKTNRIFFMKPQELSLMIMRAKHEIDMSTRVVLAEIRSRKRKISEVEASLFRELENSSQELTSAGISLSPELMAFLEDPTRGL